MYVDQKIITATETTPEVFLDPEGIIRFTGRLFSSNTKDFFSPIEEWIAQYIKNQATSTSVEICLEYINSAGIKSLFSLIGNIADLHIENHKKFVINWYYHEDDQSMYEDGEFFSSTLNLPFNFIEISDNP